MLSRFKRRPSPAFVISIIALSLALVGTAIAGQVNLETGKIKPKSIGGGKLKANTVTGAKVKESTLGTVPSATSATSATTAANASALGGVPASGYTQNACSSLTGAVKGFARLDPTNLTAGFSTAGVEIPYNCSGQTVEARRTNVGRYEVRFNGSPVTLATTDPNPQTDLLYFSNSHLISAGVFAIRTYGSGSGSYVDSVVTIVAP